MSVGGSEVLTLLTTVREAAHTVPPVNDLCLLQMGGSATALQASWALLLWKLCWSPCSATRSCCTVTCTAGRKLVSLLRQGMVSTTLRRGRQGRY